jgi:hypothetical protein
MYPPPPGSTRPPSTLEVIQSDLNRVIQFISRLLTTVIEWVFDITQHGAQRRRNFFFVLIMLAWIGGALLTHPIRWELWLADPLTLLIDMANAIFAADVMRHVIVVLLGYWLAFRVATLYLDDIFEISDTSVAERFIRQAAFASQYDWIEIRDGAIGPGSRNSPIYRIGGPGMVLTHLENAALFENVTGEPHILGTQGGLPVLESFERLREVIDLRDQVVDMTVTGRSKDGIHVTAKDLRLIFSVYRGAEQKDPYTGLPQPFSYTEQAIKNLVYKQASGPWTLAMRNLIRESLVRFIAQHTLSEFLASVSPYEAANNRGTAPQPPKTAAPSQTGRTQTAADDGDFVPRDQITHLFYGFTHGFTERAEKLGAQLGWIGLGTWETPSEIIPDQHLEAWQLSMKNQLLGNENALRGVRRLNRNKELLRLIREVPITSFGRLQAEGRDPDDVKQELLLSYREKLRNAWEVYQNNDRKPSPELEAALKHLTRLTARWLV